jgi:hypothetical protein
MLCAAGIAAPSAGATSPHDRRFSSARHGISVEAPPGWTLSTHTGYPNILVLLLHPDGSRISVAASPTPAQTARELAETNRKGLDGQQLEVIKVSAGARGGVVIEARSRTRDEMVRQLYLVRSIRPNVRQAVVLSLVAKKAMFPASSQTFDIVVSKLSLEPVLTPDSEPGAPESRPPVDRAGQSPSSGTQRSTEEQRR